MSLTASPKCKLPPIRGLILTKFRKTHTRLMASELFSTVLQLKLVHAFPFSLWRGELSWTEAWWELNPNKTSFLGSNFTFQWDQRGFPPSSKSVCIDLSVAAPICMSVCVVTLRDRMCVCGSVLSQLISLSIPLCLSFGPSLSLCFSLYPSPSFLSTDLRSSSCHLSGVH